jgi:heat-inducible transcriptional repressor
MERRKQAILKAVVAEFTDSAHPVGSNTLAERHSLQLSSATIRSELSELAELGYLQQPHTSAGRIPTDLGYRYFVDFLMDYEAVGGELRSFIRRQIRTAPADAQAVIERMATIVAAITNNAAVVSAPQGPRVKIKHLDLVSLEPRLMLLILLVEGNLLRQQVVHLEQQAGQEELTRLANRLNRQLAGEDKGRVGVRLEKLEAGLEKEVMAGVGEALGVFEQGSETLVVHDGVRNLLRQPEFADSSRLQQVLEVLEETRHLAKLLQQLVGDSDLQIVIGAENPTSQLRSCTVVLTCYGPPRGLKGALGVVGPTRMRYGQVVGRLRAVATAASDRLAELSN